MASKQSRSESNRSGDLAIMQHCVYHYQSKIHSMDELKQRVIDPLRGLEQSTIDVAIDHWRRRLRTCVHSKGGHFEHSL